MTTDNGSDVPKTPGSGSGDRITPQTTGATATAPLSPRGAGAGPGAGALSASAAAASAAASRDHSKWALAGDTHIAKWRKDNEDEARASELSGREDPAPPVGSEQQVEPSNGHANGTQGGRDDDAAPADGGQRPEAVRLSCLPLAQTRLPAFLPSFRPVSFLLILICAHVVQPGTVGRAWRGDGAQRQESVGQDREAADGSCC